MQTFIGSPALSTFRQKKLLNQLRLVLPEVEQLNAHYVHFVDADNKLVNEDEISLLEKLLRYGPHMAEISSEGKLFLVVPRAGTISPWSSKATDIAHNCSLQAVNRIERGIAYHVQCNGAKSDEPFQWSAAQQQDIADFLDQKTSEIDSLIEKTQEAIAKLDKYRMAIITAAVTGKIKVG